MKKIALLISLWFMLTACQAPLPTLVDTPVPTMTFTPIPATVTLAPTPTVTAVPTEIPTPAGYKPISEMTDVSQCKDNVISTDADVARLIAQMDQNPTGIPDVYPHMWGPLGGFPYPGIVMEWTTMYRGPDNPTPAITFCGTSESGNIWYFAIDKFPVKLAGEDKWIFVPAVFALDPVGEQNRSRTLQTGESFFLEHESPQQLFDGPHVGRIIAAIMGDRDNMGPDQLTADVFNFSAEYMELIQHLMDSHDSKTFNDRLFTGTLTQEDLDWIKTHPLPTGTIVVNYETY